MNWQPPVRSQSAAHLLLALIVALFLHTAASAQSFEQSLPQGYLNIESGGGSSLPFNSGSDSTFHWHYDTSNFAHNGPMMINEVYVRVLASSPPISMFDFDDLTVSMIEASTDHLAADPIFANNIVRAEQVRSGSFLKDSDVASTNGVTGGWVPLRFEKSFLYDPSTGHDLIVELRLKGTNTSFGALIDTVIGSGSRYGHTSDSNAASRNFSQANRSPIIKIDYTPVLEQTLPVGQMAANSNSSTSNPVNTLSDQIWQWHYDSSNFNATGPITISQVSLRAFSPTVDVNAFWYTDFEVTLIEASTDYQVGNHANLFASNILRSRIVRSGEWRAVETPASNGTSATWISLQLTDTFDYDPTTGNDFIVQVRSCTPFVTWGTSLDGVLGSGPGSVGGNRYGHTSDCNATAPSTNNNEFVPTVKISYTERDIFTYPYKENFDNFGARHDSKVTPPGWLRSEFNIDGWRFHNRGTSPASAPTDHTIGLDGNGFYAALDDSESSSIREGLETPIFYIGALNEPVATFWLYSTTQLDPIGFDANRLRIDVRSHMPGGVIVDNVGVIPSVTILQHGCWTKFAVRLGGYGSDRVSLLFNGSTDGALGTFHDFAMDDFQVAEALPSEGGQPAGPVAVLNINDCYNINGEHIESGADGPYYACATPQGVLNITIESALAFQSTALWLGPLNVGVATFGASGQMDTGTPDINGDGLPEALFPIANAFSPTPTVIDSFFFTDLVGELHLSFQLNPFLPPGVLGTFQAAVSNGPAGLRISNAVELRIE